MFCSKNKHKGMQTKESRRPSQDKTLKVFHPKQAVWNGERTKLRSYIQQWHTQFKGLWDKKAITILHKCLPPPYRDFIQDSPTLMECLQILEKFCVKETSIDSGNTDNPHKRNSRIQRQEKGDPNLPRNQELKKERVGKKSSTKQQTNQLQWDGQRSPLILYIPKWHDLLKGSKSKRYSKYFNIWYHPPIETKVRTACP